MHPEQELVCLCPQISVQGTGSNIFRGGCMMFNSDYGLLRFCSKLALRLATRHTRTENWLIATRAKVQLRRQRRDVGTVLLQPCRKSCAKVSGRFPTVSPIYCTSRLNCSTRSRNSSERQAEKKKASSTDGPVLRRLLRQTPNLCEKPCKSVSQNCARKKCVRNASKHHVRIVAASC